MAVDTPARIAIVGAGPIGIEAALYARFLGYTVDLYEQGEIAAHVRRWGHVRMFSPFGMNSSPLGLAALQAQDPGYQPPDPAALVTGQEWVESYLRPLAQSDLVVDALQEHVRVLGIARDELRKGELLASPERAQRPFRLLLRKGRSLRYAKADVVIDASGVLGQPGRLGPGGLPAKGEGVVRGKIDFGIPDLAGSRRPEFADRLTLVVGSGYSAATTIAAFAHLVASAPATRVAWITRNPPGRGGEWGPGPVPRIPDDRLPERDRLAEAANRVVASRSPWLTHWPESEILSLRWNAPQGRFVVRLRGAPLQSMEFDRIIANVGYRPDRSLYEELHVHECYASEGPMALAAALLRETSADCLAQAPVGPQALLTTEPNFYILGSKSHGRGSKFLFSAGLRQIRDLFTIIGDRAGLDLYQSIGGASLPK